MKKIIGFILAIVEILIYGVVVFLERLASSRPGVNHHLRYKKTFLMHNYLTEQNMKIVLLLAVVLLLVYIIYVSKRRKTTVFSLWEKLLGFLGIGSGIVLIASIQVGVHSSMMTYPYLIMILAAVEIVNIVILLAAFESKGAFKVKGN